MIYKLYNCNFFIFWKKITFLFIVSAFSVSLYSQSIGNDVLFKINNISNSIEEEIIKPFGDSIPFYPRAARSLFAVETEMLYVKNTPGLSYVFSVGYGQLNLRDTTNTLRDTIKIISWNSLQRKEVKLSGGIMKKVELKDSPIKFLVSARLFGTYYFDRNSSSTTNLFNTKNEMIRQAKRNLKSTREIDAGVELNLDILYSIGSKVNLGLGVANLYFFRIRDGVSLDKSVLLDSNMQIERELITNREEKGTSFFDSTNFSLIFSYSIN